MKLKFALPLRFIFVVLSSGVDAGVLTDEYDGSSYEIAIPTHIGRAIIPYEISIPERCGQSIKKVNAVVIYRPGIGSAVAFPANE